MKPTLLWAVLVTACAGGEVRIEAGGPALEATEVLRLGSLDDPGEVFTAFTALLVDGGGRIYTLHPEEHLIRVHAPDGRAVRTIGREGEGPGEFRLPAAMGFVGDTLWVFDRALRRLVYFDSAGRYLRSWHRPLSPGREGIVRMPRTRGLFHDGTVRGSSVPWSSLVASGEITRSATLRLDSAGGVLDTVATWSVANTVWAIGEPADPAGFRAYRPQPFSDTELVVVSSLAPLILRVNRAVPSEPDAAAYAVTVRRFDGDTVFHRRFAYSPREVRDDDVDSVVAEFSGAMRDERSPEAPTPERAAVLARSSLYRPRFVPPVTEAILGADGSVWLRLQDAADRAVWRVLAPDGGVVGVVRLPMRFEPMWVTTDHAWGQDFDDLDVPYLVKFHLSGMQPHAPGNPQMEGEAAGSGSLNVAGQQ